MSVEFLGGAPGPQEGRTVATGERIGVDRDEEIKRLVGGEVLGIVRRADLLPVMQNQGDRPQPEEDEPTPGGLPPRRKRRQRDEPLVPPVG